MVRLLRAAIVVATAFVLGAALAPASANAADLEPGRQPFYADSGDSCPYGITEGELSWRSQAGRAIVIVGVKGVVVDRPTPGDPKPCAGDPRFTVAMFTAYAGKAVVAQDGRRVNNGALEFGLILDATSAVAPIETVVVQVCRFSFVGGPFDYCGTAQVYKLT